MIKKLSLVFLCMLLLSSLAFSSSDVHMDDAGRVIKTQL